MYQVLQQCLDAKPGFSAHPQRVFGFYSEPRPDLPPVASGGRYDALSRVLGQGREIPAVGGVIRPELTLQLAEGRA